MSYKPKNSREWAYYPRCPRCGVRRGKQCKDLRNFADGELRFVDYPHEAREAAAAEENRRRNQRRY